MSPRRVDHELTARRREALIKAGYAEILEKGLHATTIDSVVARAAQARAERSTISTLKKTCFTPFWTGCSVNSPAVLTR